MMSNLLTVHPITGFLALALLFAVSYLLVLGGKTIYRAYFQPKKEDDAIERARISPTPRQVRATTKEAAKHAEPKRAPRKRATPKRKLIFDPEEVSEFYVRKK